MKKYFLLSCFFIPALVTAQTSLSLQQALTLGLKNRYDVQANQYNLDIAGAAITNAKRAWLPDLSGKGDIRYNTQFQASYIPGGFIGNKPELIALSARNTTVFGLDLDQAIYDPSINNNIRITRNELALQREKNRAAEIVIKTKISEAYLDMLLRQLQYNIALKDEQRYKEYFSLAQGKYDQRALIESDYLHAKLDYENAKLQTVTAAQQNGLALQQLKYQLNMPVSDSLSLTDSLNSITLFADNTPAGKRTELLQLELQHTDEQLQLRKAKQALLPTLSFTANYSQQFLYDNFNYTKREWWSPFSYLGLALKIPIAAHVKNNLASYHLQMKQTVLNLQQQTADIDNEVRETTTTLNNAQQNVQITRNNYDLSGKIYAQQQLQYNLGAFQYSSLLETERSIATAEQNYVKAVYDYLVAKLQYMRATDKL